MSNWVALSARTKRRKIAYEISKIVADVSSVANHFCHSNFSDLSGVADIADMSHSDTHVVQPFENAAHSSQSELLNAICLADSESCTEHDASLAPGCDTFNELVCATDLEDSESHGLHELNMLTVDGNSNQSINLQLIDNSDWTARDAGDTDDEDEKLSSDETTLRDRLASWAVAFNIPHAALSDLLVILQPSELDLPKDARTLLHTHRQIKTVSLAGGDYYYFGLKYWLQILLGKFSSNLTVNQLTLHVNIDGIPLFKSSTTCLWPILGTFVEIEGSPFPVAVYCSSHKPDSIDDYLEDFIEEVKALQSSGFYHDVGKKTYQIKLGAVICDAPARAFLKCIKTHNGYDCCERCVQRGKWLGKVILPDLMAPLRTDDSFSNREDFNHHTGKSPFTQLACGMELA
jgi:hypothetical protein